MNKLAATNKKLRQRVSDARSSLRFDKLEGAPSAGHNADDTKINDPSNVAELSLNYEGVGNGHGPVIGGRNHT